MLTKTAICLIVVSIAVIIHQVIIWGIWWDWSQFLHHENIAAIGFVFAIGLIVGKYYKGGNKNGAK